MDSSSEKLCLKWNEFQQNIISSYHKLRKDYEYSDVTLVCEEGQQIEAHRIILSACSLLFSTLLKETKHSHPIIFMRGIKAKDLAAIMDFIYHGEANIYQKDLDGFLALAEELKVKGLAGSQNFAPEPSEDAKEKRQNSPQKPALKQENYIQPIADWEDQSYTTQSDQRHPIETVEASKLIVAANTNMEDLRVKLDSMMEKIEDGEYKWKCTVCGKANKGRTGIARQDMRRHIETHMEGLAYPCNQCEKISRSSRALIDHVSRHHRK